MFNRRKTLKTKEIIQFCRQLTQLLEQGIGLRSALLLMSDLEEKWQEHVVDIVTHLESGASMSESMQRNGFPSLLTSFVMAGEQHNGLVQALKKGEQYYQRKYEVKQKLMKALVYPLMVIVLMIVAFIILQTTVLPRFASLYDTLGIELPWYTQLLLTVNDMGLKLASFILIPVLAIVLFLVWRRRQSVLARLFQLSLKLPLIRETWQLRFTSVFSWQLGLLLQAGIPLAQAFDMIMESWPWEYSKRAIFRIQQRLKKGFDLQASFFPESGKSFHALLPKQLAIGESSGMVAETLLYSGAMADERLEERVQWLLRVWEPLLILLIGGLLAAMVLALFVPMLSLVEGL